MLPKIRYNQDFYIAKRWYREIYLGQGDTFGQYYFFRPAFKFLSQMIRQNPQFALLHKRLLGDGKWESPRKRIHLMIAMGMSSHTLCIPLLQEVLKNQDTDSRIRGHAAEILHVHFDQKNAFEEYIDLMQKEAKKCIAYAERNEDWRAEDRKKIKNIPANAIDFFIDIIKANYGEQTIKKPYHKDENLIWYAMSVLFRVKNLAEYVEHGFLDILCIALHEPKDGNECRARLERIRAYAAEIIGELLWDFRKGETKGIVKTKWEKIKRQLEKKIYSNDDEDVKLAAKNATGKLNERLKPDNQQ